MPRRTSLGTVLAVALCACSEAPSAAPAPKSGGFVGAATCGECHEERWRGFQRTTHHLTSQQPSKETVLGSFTPPGNRLTTANPNLWFDMEEKPAGLFVTACFGDGAARSERIDVVVGSGKFGQSYLSWRGALLFQLPVSYFHVGDAWRNSPGERYRDGTADFDRAVLPRCIECHATWFGISPSFTGGYLKDDIVLGISCERCHGPGAEHVAWHRAHPDSKEPVAITSPADLTRERSLDLCGQCHGGVGELARAPFTYRPGEVLADHVRVDAQDPNAPPGVHSANQLVRLRQSRCFEKSDRMTCATCHDPHVFEQGDVARFSKRCQECHEPTSCGMQARVGPSIAANCIDCHMHRVPVQTTMFDTPGATLHPTMLDHRIAIDRAAAEAYLKSRTAGK